jgi:acetolactate synthase-1/2/3 large subunit
MAEMTGGQAIIKSLHREGVRTIFGIPGVQIMSPMDALYDQSDIQFIITRNESGASYMADGYARTGVGVGFGTAMVVPGPGVQNTSSGIGTAFASSSPVFLVAGQIPTINLGKHNGVLHEIDDQLDIIQPITKWSARLLSPTEVPGAVHEAVRQMKTGRPRPVEIEMAPDVMASTAEVELMEPEGYPPKQADPDLASKAAKLLAEAKTPMIWVGGGIQRSPRGPEFLLKIAEYLQTPVITSKEGKGAIDERHYLALGAQRRLNEADELTEIIDGADVILVVGSRFYPVMAKEPSKVIQIDADPEEIGRNYPATVGIEADAGEALAAIYEKLNVITSQRPVTRREEFEARKRSLADWYWLRQPNTSIVKQLREVLPDDGIYVNDMTQISHLSHGAFPVYQPRTYITSSYYGTLGSGFPTAIGAKVACPDRAVISINGDGGFMFNQQELATAVQHNIPVIALVFNDHAYGNSKMDQEKGYNGRIIGTELRNPDFAKLADAYGADGLKLVSPNHVGDAVKAALENNRPTIIEVPVDGMQSSWNLPPREKPGPFTS